jgi:hypothetical protein
MTGFSPCQTAASPCFRSGASLCAVTRCYQRLTMFGHGDFTLFGANQDEDDRFPFGTREL